MTSTYVCPKSGEAMTAEAAERIGVTDLIRCDTAAAVVDARWRVEAERAVRVLERRAG